MKRHLIVTVTSCKEIEVVKVKERGVIVNWWCHDYNNIGNLIIYVVVVWLIILIM
jgi:hypothetical protein